MDIRITSTVLEVATKDLARALEFYRLLGLDVPQPDSPHVEVELPGGNRLAFDDEEIIAGMHPGWTPPTQQGRVAVAFAVSEPAHVDALFEKVTAAGHPGPLTQSRKRQTGEVTDFAVQMRLVGVAGRGRRVGGRHPAVEESDRATEPKDAA